MLPPETDGTDALVGFGDDLTRALNALTSGGTAGACKWFRFAFTELEAASVTPETPDHPRDAPVLEAPSTDGITFPTIGHELERVLQQGGELTVEFTLDSPYLSATLTPTFDRSIERPILIRPTKSRPHGVAQLRQATRAFRDQFPYTMGQTKWDTTDSLLLRGLRLSISHDDGLLRVASTGFNCPHPAKQATTPSPARVRRWFGK